MADLYGDLRQDWDPPTVADVALLEAALAADRTGDLRRAFCRFVRNEIVEAFDEGTSEGEILAGGRTNRKLLPTTPAEPET